MLLSILIFKGSSARCREAATSKKGCKNGYQPSPIRSHFVSRPPNTPPPDECTTYKSVLTTLTATPTKHES